MTDSRNEWIIRVSRSLQNAFQVLDTRRNVKYLVRQKASLFGKTYLISDELGNDTAVIRRQFALVLPRYRIRIGDDRSITIRRKFAFQPGYRVTGAPWLLEGDVPGRCFCATDARGNLVFEIRKTSGTWPDKYSIFITEDSICLNAVCIAVAMDAMDEDIRNARTR